MKRNNDWKTFWKETAERSASDFEYDRGRSPRQKEIEELSNQELLSFIDPSSSDVVFDAGCGTGANIVLLHQKVQRLIGMDYSTGAIARCKKKILSNKIENVEFFQGDITSPPLPDNSVDKIICMSVLQYLSDWEVRKCFTEFMRILKDRGIVILHVKNIVSLYLSTLWLGKKAKFLLGKKAKLEYLRSYNWYRRELESVGFEVLEYNSFNLLMVEYMPKRLLQFLQRVELKYRHKWPLRLGFIRRRGSDLKIKARIEKVL